jgi:hypothetical protein
LTGEQFRTERDCLNAGGKWQAVTNRCEIGR